MEKSVAIPWGSDGSLELKLPAAGLIAGADVETVWPDLSGPLDDYPSALARAIESPVGSSPLEQHVAPGARVAIVVDDPSRWTPIREALPIILRRLHAVGVRHDDVAIIVGVGRHHAVGTEAMHRRLGDSVAANYRCFSPPLDDLSAYVDLGQTHHGIPVRRVSTRSPSRFPRVGGLGSAAPSSRLRRWLQTDFSRNKPSFHAGGAASPGLRPPIRRRGPLRWQRGFKPHAASHP